MNPEDRIGWERLRGQVMDSLALGPPVILRQDGVVETFWEAQDSRLRLLAKIDTLLEEAKP